MPLTDTTTATLEKGSEPTNQRAGDFFVQANRRYVVPYFVDLKMNCKGKWFGRTVLNVFQEDFPFQPSAYFARAVKVGRLFAVRKGKTLPATELLKVLLLSVPWRSNSVSLLMFCRMAMLFATKCTDTSHPYLSHASTSSKPTDQLSLFQRAAFPFTAQDDTGETRSLISSE